MLPASGSSILHWTCMLSTSSKSLGCKEIRSLLKAYSLMERTISCLRSKAFAAGSMSWNSLSALLKLHLTTHDVEPFCLPKYECLYFGVPFAWRAMKKLSLNRQLSKLYKNSEPGSISTYAIVFSLWRFPFKILMWRRHVKMIKSSIVTVQLQT